MNRATLSLMGPFLLADAHGREVAVSGRKARALLAYLALEPGAHRREALVGLLWPDLPEKEARNNLRVTVSRLRRALEAAGEGSATIGGDTHKLLFEAGALEIDSRRFDGLLDGAARHRHDDPGRCESCLQQRRAAAELWRGELLEGLAVENCEAFEGWLSLRRGEQRERLASLLSSLADEHLARGDHAAALGYRRRHLAIDPLDEASNRSLLRLWALRGQRSAALEHFRDFESLLERDLGVAPEAATVALVRQIESGAIVPARDGGAAPEIPGRRSNLPEDPTPFVGRVRERERLVSHLGEHRLVTLLGPGGSGKTRLAIATGREVLDRFEHGVFLVRLAPLRSPDDILPALADAVGYVFEAGTGAREQLLAFLKPKRMLLLLDNFEHLSDGADLVADILGATPDIRMLVTSRQRLDLRSEAVFPLSGLAYPETVDDGADEGDYEAVRLFIDSARRSRLDFEADALSLPAISRICRLVEGMPLGIVLAASWTDTLSPAEIADELRSGLDLLETDLRDVPERQRSVRAAFDHSWRLLGSDEQTVFAALSVFRGGFDRPAARDVAGASLRQLTSLVHKSLIQHPPDLARYDTHELTRQFAEEKLTGSGERERVLDRHRDHYLERLAAHRQALAANTDPGLADTVDADFENIRAAWLRAVEGRDLPLLAGALEGLRLLLSVRNRFQDAIALFEAALGALRGTPASRERDRLELELLLAPLFAYRAVRGFTAPELRRGLDGALALSERLDEERLPLILYGLFSYHYSASEHRTALAISRRLLALAEQGRDTPMLVMAHLLNLAVNTLMGDLATADEHYRLDRVHYRPEQHHRLAHRYGYDFGIMAPAYGAMVQWLHGFPDRALATVAAGLDAARERGHPLSLGHVFTFTAFVHGWCGAVEVLEDQAREALAFSRRHRLRGYTAIATFALGWALGLQGDRQGLALIAEGFALMHPALNLQSLTLTEAARLRLRFGEAAEAERLLAQAEQHIAASDERIFEAEVARLRGELVRDSDPERAAECFEQALALARQQGARSLELRAATSLARLESARGNGAAIDRLRAIFDEFDEGFGTADLLEARALLDSTQGPTLRPI